MEGTSAGGRASNSSDSRWRSYTLTSQVFLRYLSAIFFVAFASLWVQLPGLLHENGILPVKILLKQSKIKDFSSGLDVLRTYPSVVVLADYFKAIDADTALDAACIVGMAAALLSLTRGGRTGLMLIQWALYLSLFIVGQTFLQFQWDVLLLEVGFASILLAPWRKGRSEEEERPPLSALYLVRWVLFKLMFQSGVVKIQADCPTWKKLTACHYHFATQCIPTPLAWYFNQMPSILLKISVAATLWIEIACSILIIIPFTGVQKVAAVPQIILQIFIILTGNYNFFNLLTIGLCLTLFDDTFFSSRGQEAKSIEQEEEHSESIVDALDRLGPLGMVYCWIEKNAFLAYSFSFAFCVASLYYLFQFDYHPVDVTLLTSKESLQEFVDAYLPIMIALYGIGIILAGLHDISLALKRDVFNLLWKFAVVIMVVFTFTAGIIPMTQILSSQRQIWPAVWDAYKISEPFSLVSSYGLFRRMTGVGDVGGDGNLVSRPEIEIQGSFDQSVWHTFNFTDKADDRRSPPWVAPHQPRLDWQMWFSALNPNFDRWFLHFIYKLLNNEKPVLALLGRNPLFEERPPRWIRVARFHYNFTTFASGDSKWWRKSYVSHHMPLHKDDERVIEYLRETGFEVTSSMPTAEDWMKQSLKDNKKASTPLQEIWTLHRFEILVTVISLLLLPSILNYFRKSEKRKKKLE